MQQDTFIVDVLFPAIPLMMVKLGNCYSIMANLIRHLHAEVIRDSVSPKDAERFLLQISRLYYRLQLINIIQYCTAVPFVLALGAMRAAYFYKPTKASILYFGSMLLTMGSKLLSTRKIQIANRALDVHLSNLKKHQESEQYLKPKHRRRAATRT